MKSLFLTLLFFATSSWASVPPNCTVTNWCLRSSTTCVFTRILNPQGLYQGEAQYSVVRAGQMMCEMGYGQWQTVDFTTPVEAVIFRSGVETDIEVAKAEALRLCTVYRHQWLDAAPLCQF